jgi:glycosyltransferase involved in cell wall biosynthesis
MFKKLIKLAFAISRYFFSNPGKRSIFRLVRLSFQIFAAGGWSSLKLKIIHFIHHNERQNSFLVGAETLKTCDNYSLLKKDIAVHLHVFYLNLIDEIIDYLKNFPCDFTLYITTNTKEKLDFIQLRISRSNLKCKFKSYVTQNKGRDIAPMFFLSDQLLKHDLVLHLHTKRSPHNFNLAGWRRYLLMSLIGNSGVISSIVNEFEKRPKLGIFFPTPFEPIRKFMNIGGNIENISKILDLAGLKSEINNLNTNYFPAGSMFWFNPNSLINLFHINFDSKDFEDENGQTDSTLSHAIERLFPLFARKTGFDTCHYIAPQFDLDSKLLKPYFGDLIQKVLGRNFALIFDHASGGGTNFYTGQLIKGELQAGANIFKCSFKEDRVHVDCISQFDAISFRVKNYEELFDLLHKHAPKKIIINSIYSYPNPKLFIKKVIYLSNTKNIDIEYKLHDFYPLCPSAHLLNNDGVYCNIPEDLSICDKCLKKHPSRHAEVNWVNDIVKWREVFFYLFQNCKNITFFDQSSIDLFEKVYLIDSKLIQLIPHDVKYFNCLNKINLKGKLHIGILGVMTRHKGSEIVNLLSDHVSMASQKVEITLIGGATVPLHRGVKVLGEYNIESLYDLVKLSGINVVLFPSIVPETFSFTISEAMKMQLPIVAFDIGAQGRRLKQYKYGKVIPTNASPEKIYQTIHKLHKEVLRGVL